MPTEIEIAQLMDSTGMTRKEALRQLASAATTTPTAMQHDRTTTNTQRGDELPEAVSGLGVVHKGNTASEVTAASEVSHGRRGRPALVERLTDEHLLVIRQIALSLPLRTDVVSHSLALRLFAERPECPEWFRTYLSARASKHSIPRSIMDAIRIAERTVAHAQAPGREALQHEAYAPGTMRRDLDGRRLEGGQVESWDDASVNFILWTEIDGQIRCGRFQLLLGVDHGTDYVVGFGFVARPKDSYRAEDVLGRAMLPTWQAHGCPERVVLERGTWAAHRVGDALAALRIERSTSYHPRTKLVESIFHRLWTRLGSVKAGVGRSRGEDEHGTELLMKIRRGSLDARQHCLSLGEASEAVRAACEAHNREPIESRHYGRWVPEQRWQAEAPKHLRQIQPSKSDWAARPERRELTIRKGGMLCCQVDSGWGFSTQFAWASQELWDKVGRAVTVYFDPLANPCEATVVDTSRREVIAASATLLTGDAGAATEIRRQQTALVRAEHRALRPGGGVVAATSEVRDTDQTRVTTVSRAAPAAPAPRTDRAPAAPAPLAARSRSVAPATEADIDLDALEAAEASARALGLIPAY